MLTWAQYLETTAGQRYVVVVFLHRLLDVSNAPTSADLNTFAHKFALDAPFRSLVKSRLAAQDSRPELVGSIRSLVKAGNKLTLRLRVDNVSATATGKPIDVQLRLATGTGPNVSVVLATKRLAALGALQGVDVTLVGTAPSDPTGRLALASIDSGGIVAEQSELDNITWTRVR